MHPPTASPTPTEGSLPEYLPEEDEDFSPTPNDPRSAVATTGAAIKDAASTMFSAAASLLTKSFYW